MLSMGVLYEVLLKWFGPDRRELDRTSKVESRASHLRMLGMCRYI
jgi:hypothetical protein